MAAFDSSSDIKTIEHVAEALRSRDPRRAASLAEAAISDGLRHPILFNALALWLSAQGRHDEALADFKRAEAMAPPNAATQNAIGLCLTKLGRPAEAIEAFDAAIALQPESAQLHYRKGWALEVAGDLQLALEAHRRAIALDPDYTDALARLAFLAARVGAWGDARFFAARALERNCRQTAADLALAMCDLEDAAYDNAEQRLNKVLNDESAGATDRYLALGLLGDVQDKQGRTGNAFAFYEQANDLVRQWRPAGAPTMLETTSALCRYFEALAPRPRVDSQVQAKLPHIFLLGFLRSGTTLLEQVLTCHDDVVTLEEKDTLADAIRAFMARPRDLEQLWAADEKTLTDYREAYWRRVKSFGVVSEGKIVVDKMPINTIKIPLIARLFPDATILLAIRDPRDVVLSCFRRSFGFNATTYEFLTLESAARFYDTVMRLADLYRAKLSPNLYQLRLEDLIEDFDGQVRALCDFTGLPWSETMRDFAEQSKGRGITTPSAIQVIQGLNSKGVGQWRRYSDQMAPVLPILKPWVERYGYPQD
ncbi:MAG: sulfotransferase [Rhizomicrobium sp.]